jgi:hypothetical protein
VFRRLSEALYIATWRMARSRLIKGAAVLVRMAERAWLFHSVTRSPRAIPATSRREPHKVARAEVEDLEGEVSI